MTTSRGYRVDLAIALTFVALAAGFTLYFVGLGGGLPSFGSSYTLRALLPTAGSLTPGARVTVAGYRVGAVTSIDRDGSGALVRMELDDHRVTPLPADSRIALRVRTPVGENYVSLLPGTSSRSLASGSVLPMTRADDSVDVDQLLSVLQGETRRRARRLIEGMGAAVQGRGGQLNAFLGGTADALATGSQVVRVLAQDRSQIGRLVANLGDVSAQVGGRGADIRTLANGALTTFDAVSARDDALKRLIDVLPSTLAQVRDTTNVLSAVSQTGTPVVANLAATVSQIRPAVRVLAPAAGEGQALVSELGVAAPALQQTLGRLQGLAKPAADALPDVHRTLCQINPMLRYLGPYIPDVISALGGLGSAANAYDALGHLIRITFVVNDNSLVGLPPWVSTAAYTLMHAGLLSKVGGPLTFDPYPKPGQIGKEHATASDHVIGPSQVPSTGYRFPHVLSDC